MFLHYVYIYIDIRIQSLCIRFQLECSIHRAQYTKCTKSVFRFPVKQCSMHKCRALYILKSQETNGSLSFDSFLLSIALLYVLSTLTGNGYTGFVSVYLYIYIHNVKTF